LGGSWADVSLIPETLERTNLGEASPGDKLNVECDLVAKYVERLAAPFAGKEPT
jgi:riboflavin synthase